MAAASCVTYLPFFSHLPSQFHFSPSPFSPPFPLSFCLCLAPSMLSNISEKLSGYQSNQRAEIVVCEDWLGRACNVAATLHKQRSSHGNMVVIMWWLKLCNGV